MKGRQGGGLAVSGGSRPRLSRPSRGPGISNQNSHSTGRLVRSALSSSTARAEMLYPKQLIRVRALPITSGGALRADRVDNWGESPTTANPHSSQKGKTSQRGMVIISGESTQQTPDRASSPRATGILP